jgi:arylsulfatase A-like enzyme
MTLNNQYRHGQFIKMIILFFLILGDMRPSFAQSKPDLRPNILLIVADDLGYTDLGCFGGDIKTPNIDLLAKQGILFTQFHTSPLCAPTRSMILSGNDNHVAGMGSMFSVEGTPRAGKPGYEGHLTDRIVTVAQILKDGGYQTFMSGKWHLGSEDEFIPYAKGFEKSFALLNGAANHFNNNPIFIDEPPQYRQDNQVVQFPPESFSTDVYTNKMIGFIKDARKDKPFFAYLTYTAPHWPLQVPADYIDRYKGKYDMGYDSLRVIRFNRQKAMGIIPASVVLRPRNPAVKPWSDLSEANKKTEARKMEIYAAMIENLDDHIGRLIQYLKDSHQLENTVIVFMSDNGAAGQDLYKLPEGNGPFLREHYDNRYENMGTASSFVCYGPGWAQASMAPFKLFKSYSTEGGIVTPLIISGKFIHKNPGIQNVFINVMDLAPGFIELAQLSYPAIYQNKKVVPMLGESFVPYLKGESNRIHKGEYIFGLEHSGQCSLIQGDWKITNISDPFDERAFALYKLSDDMGETQDLSGKYPNKFAEMMNLWAIFKKKEGVIPLEKGE